MFCYSFISVVVAAARCLCALTTAALVRLVIMVNVRLHKIKVKVKLSLCFNWAPRHGGVLGEWRYSSTHSLTSALDGGEWSASCPGHFTPRKRAHGTHWIGGWVGPRAVLDAAVKKKIPSPRRKSNPRTPLHTITQEVNGVKYYDLSGHAIGQTCPIHAHR
jgi:hypothetical protein